MKCESNIINGRVHVSKAELHFGVNFIGYSADIVAIQKGKENVQYANMDFITECTVLEADAGMIFIDGHFDLEPVIENLPLHSIELKRLCEKTARPSDEQFIEMNGDRIKIMLRRGADVDAFIQQISGRYRQIKELLEQTRKVGVSIERYPYEDYVEEIERTGIARVILYGVGRFKNGKLIFRPAPQAFLVNFEGAQMSSM